MNLDAMPFHYCDYHELPLVDGWHIRSDPEGLGGDQRIPCSLAAVVPTPRKHRHEWQREWNNPLVETNGYAICRRCGAIRDEVKARRGKQSRNYGNRAELSVARTYGGEKIGHAGGPVDVRGADFSTQVKTHRRQPPREWTSAFTAMAASKERCPRMLLRFVLGPGVPPADYFVFQAKDFLDWFGRDE